MTRTDAGLRALSKATPIDPASVQRYVHSKFGEALDDAYAAMQQLATSRPPEVLAAEAYQLYEHLRSAIPCRRQGLGRQGTLDLEAIRQLATAGKPAGSTRSAGTPDLTGGGRRAVRRSQEDTHDE